MDNELLSDKENIGPEVHYIVSPVSGQGNTSVEEPCHVGSEDGGTPQTPPNTSRKRVNIYALRDTPPRSSYSSQMRRIFTSSSPPKAITNTEVPPNISRDSLRTFEDFSQALHGCPISRGSPHVTDIALEKSDPLSDSEDHITCTEDVQNSDESHSGVDDDDDVELQVGGCHVDQFSPTHPQQEDNTSSANSSPDPLHNLPDPLSPLERAVAFSFSPSPSRAERRKTLNINIQPSPQQPRQTKSPPRIIESIENGDKDSSVGDWTGDEVFFHPFHSHRRQAVDDRNNAQSCTESAASPLPPTPPGSSPPKICRVGDSKKQHDPIPPPLPVRGPRAMRFLRSSRFHVPAVRTPFGAGVPLSVEEHPSSKGSDADDEDEGSDTD